MIPNNDPDKDSYLPLLVEVRQTVLDIKSIVLDLQVRQKEMDARQQTIKHEIEESPTNQPIGSFATGYQQPKK